MEMGWKIIALAIGEGYSVWQKYLFRDAVCWDSTHWAAMQAV